MSSWPVTQPPYPPRDRSRSPSRGAYGRAPYPDSAYQDGYRGDWEVYDRERWAYDRDRGYDGRPSPEDETGKKRRRSISPYDRGDRYEPRPRYNDDFDAHSRSYGYGGSPPRRGGAGGGGGYSNRRAPVDPHTLDYPASLKQYADWFRYFFPQQAIEEDNADKAATQEAGDGSKPRNGIKSKWEKYKKEFASQQLQTMFEHHRKSPWFAEKYDPALECVELRKRLRKEGWKGRIDLFLNELDAGTYDPDLNQAEPGTEASIKEEATNGDATTLTAEKPEAGETKEDPKLAGDDDMQFEAEDDQNEPDAARADATGKTSDARRGKDDGRGEEVAVMPETNTVMIRTIPPDIGRIKLEQACSTIDGFMYLALGEPLQKRNYYRAGWIRFKEDADMPNVMTELTEKKIEGFKLHVTHALRPFVNKARYAPEVASKPERMEKDLANAKALTMRFEEEAAILRMTKFKKSSSADAQKTGDESKTDTDTTMSEPQEDGEDELEPRDSGVSAIERRVEKILDELRENGAKSEYLEEKKTEIALDLYIAYLRAAFNTCYYCSIVTNHLEELQRRCVKHGRKPLSKSMLEEIKGAASTEKEEKKEGEDDSDVKMEDKEDAEKKDDKDKAKDDKKAGGRDWKRNDERWLEWFDSKIALLLDRDNVDPREYGGKVYEDELSKAIEPFIKQEDEGKFRCKTCQKLFKATSFVEKHVVNKHAELVKSLDDIAYFNNFALDPHRIQPLSHPPAATSNQSAPPQAYGLQAPPAHYGPDYRGGHDRAYPPPYPYPYGGYWDPYAPGYTPYPPNYPPYPPPRDDRRGRLSDRVGGFATPGETIPPAAAGLPPKPTAALDSALVAGNGNTRRGPVAAGMKSSSGPPPPPPPDAKEDPRAAKRVSYHDMDLVAEGDVELQY